MTKLELKRELGIGGAMLLGLGSIMGTGVYVALGLAANHVGDQLVLVILAAACLALCNGLSSAQLAAAYPVSGGSYEYGYQVIGPRTGFLAGWLFLCAKSASAATAALGIAAYLSAVFGLGRSWLIVVALGALTVVAFAVFGGLKRSNRLNALLVLTTLFVLLFIATQGFLTDLPPVVSQAPQSSWPDYFEACALVFVAFTGYGRIATMGEEIREPARNIPRAVYVTILVTAMVYILIAEVSLKALGAEGFSLASERGRPLTEVAVMIDLPLAQPLTAVAAISAMMGVLLNLVLGLSRVVLAMGRRDDLPAMMARVDVRGTTPRPATALVVLIITGLILIGDLRFAWSFSALTVLGYYGIANLSALLQAPSERRYPRLVPLLGLGGCLGLVLFIDASVWLIAGPVVALGLVYKMIRDRLRSR